MNKRQLAAAFAAGKTGACHNAHTDGTRYRLHRSDIVRKEAGRYVFDWSGWYTPTTASHMNEVLRAINANIRVAYSTARDNGHTTFEVPA